MGITQKNIDSVIELAKKYQVKRLLLFGSALNNPQNANDLDIGVEGIDEAEFLAFGAELEDILLKSVDLIPIDLDNLFVSHIKKHGKYIYENPDFARRN